MIREGKTPEEFNKNPEMLWTDILTPLLEKALKSSHEEACLLVKACLPYLESHAPSPESHRSFVELVVKLGEGKGRQQSFNKPFKLALEESEPQLFKGLTESGSHRLASNLANALKKNGAALNRIALCYLFLSFPELLAISDPEARKQIYTIFNTLTKEDIAAIDPVDVARPAAC